MFNNHSQIRNPEYTDMFSCVQELPLMASPPEVDWCGRTLGHTREETTICIKGRPGDFIVDQPEHTDNEEALCQPDDKKAFDAHHLHEPSSTAQHPPANTPSANQSSGVNAETAKCQRAVTNLFDRDHVVSTQRNFTTKHLLPLADRDLGQWRKFLTDEANANLAEEVIKYFQAEARELITRDAKAIRISFKVCRCKVVEPETQKYIKCTVFTGLTEITIPQYQQSQQSRQSRQSCLPS